MGQGAVGILTGSVLTIVLIIGALGIWTKMRGGDLSTAFGGLAVLLIGAFVYALSQDHALVLQAGTEVAKAVL
jgi:hypothetical protein